MSPYYKSTPSSMDSLCRYHSRESQSRDPVGSRSPHFRYHHHHGPHVLLRGPTPALCSALRANQQQHTRRKISERTIHIAKNPGENFGAQLWHAYNKVYVVFVLQYVGNLPLKGHIPQRETAAYRAGLKFADELLSINEETVSGLSLVYILDRLQNASNLLLEVLDTPLERVHMIYPDNKAPMGIIYSQSKVTKVYEGSLAEQSHIRAGHTIVAVDDSSLVGAADAEVSAMIKRQLDQCQPFKILTMPSKAYIKLCLGAQMASSSLPAPWLVRSVPISVFIDCDFDLVISKLRYLANLRERAKSKTTHNISHIRASIESNKVQAALPTARATAPSARLSIRIRDLARTGFRSMRRYTAPSTETLPNGEGARGGIDGEDEDILNTLNGGPRRTIV